MGAGAKNERSVRMFFTKIADRIAVRAGVWNRLTLESHFPQIRAPDVIRIREIAHRKALCADSAIGGFPALTSCAGNGADHTVAEMFPRRIGIVIDPAFRKNHPPLAEG